MNAPAEPLVPATELRIIIALLRLGVSSAPELARFLSQDDASIRPDTVNRLLYRLQDRGFVETRKEHSSRLWFLVQAKAEEVLRAEVQYIVWGRHNADPKILSLLLEEIQTALAASTPQQQTRISS
jgi:predicted transcriptional regulator